MKAAVYYEGGGPEVLRYEEVPDPECHPKGVVVDVKAVSIEGGDVLSRAAGIKFGDKHVVGYQCAGVISEVGERVQDRHVGQRVVCMDFFGSHAEKRAVRPASTWLVPDELPLEQAACIPIPFGTASDCLFEFGRLQAGQKVLVQGGAGGVGHAAVQLAKLAGAEVLATASSDDKLARLKDLGMDHGINYADRDLVAEVKALTGGQGVDLVVDPVGGKVLQQSLQCLAYRGHVVSCGNASRGRQLLDVAGMGQNNQSLTCIYFGGDRMHGNDGRVQELVESLIARVASGQLKVLVDRTFPLSEAAAAHAHIEGRTAVGRTVLIP